MQNWNNDFQCVQADYKDNDSSSCLSPVFLLSSSSHPPVSFLSSSLVLARDCDTGLNSELSYFIQSPDFAISSRGVVSPSQRLDYERPNHMYEFVVVAVDNGTPPRTGTASIRFRMANTNDEAPIFSQAVYVVPLSVSPSLTPPFLLSFLLSYTMPLRWLAALPPPFIHSHSPSLLLHSTPSTNGSCYSELNSIQLVPAPLPSHTQPYIHEVAFG